MRSRPWGSIVFLIMIRFSLSDVRVCVSDGAASCPSCLPAVGCGAASSLLHLWGILDSFLDGGQLFFFQLCCESVLVGVPLLLRDGLHL